ncbi:hypothetical protein [Duganella callida]|uniref:Uncharacterized protein n=1 Tax=Duganella callida TaxID=2561932 RepID=A0A4Y9S3I3_9BURK|nr:hypothetical protein [Duganella callida]TFW15952.1 hypothetical protein E4L98_24980 [Duganella callida]
MMNVQKTYMEAKQRADQGLAADEMADWFIKTILSAEQLDFPEPKHLLIADGSPRGWALYVGAHRKDFAGIVQHARMDGQIIGQLVLRESLPNGEFGPIIFSRKILEAGFEFSDGSVVHPYYMGETTNPTQTRRRIAIELLHAIQEALPQI